MRREGVEVRRRYFVKRAVIQDRPQLADVATRDQLFRHEKDTTILARAKVFHPGDDFVREPFFNLLSDDVPNVWGHGSLGGSNRGCLPGVDLMLDKVGATRFFVP